MHEGHVEQTRYQRNALDVLAQQVVAIIAYPPLHGEAAERRLKKFRSEEMSLRALHMTICCGSCVRPLDMRVSALLSLMACWICWRADIRRMNSASFVRDYVGSAAAVADTTAGR